MADVPKAVWTGTFNIFDVDVICHVLEDGQRIIEADSMAKLVDALMSGVPPGDFEEFTRWTKGQSP